MRPTLELTRRNFLASAAGLALAERLPVPARFVDAAALEAETPRLANPSAVVFREVGCHGVAEAAALAAALRVRGARRPNR